MSNARTGFITPWRLLGGGFVVLAVFILYIRFTRGIGAVTNLSDEFPWGLWVGFDILVGIGLVAGGFLMAGAVYVFHLDRYRPIVRRALLTALIGYIIFIVGLTIEIGRPWNMWRVITNHNIHSPMFEIAWCVILYTIVLALEFSIVVFEKYQWRRMIALYQKVAVFLVIAGVILSTLHQSTLGTLFTIMPYRMHELWYTPLQPIHFFITCIAGGIAMLCLESFLSRRFLNHDLPMDILPRLARIMAVVLVIYVVYRFGDLAFRGALGSAFIPGVPALLFWLENIFFVVIPVALVAQGGLRISRKGLFLASFLAVIGFMTHRLNVVITAREYADPVNYFPSWMEVVVSYGLIAAGFVATGIAVKLFPTLQERPTAGAERGGR